MTSNTRREREKKELRTRILDAARELFAEHGFEAVTMRKIAEKIEYTPTALYFHFADKDALIRELCANDFQVLAESFASFIGITDPVERFRAIGRGYANFAISHPQHYRMMFMTPATREMDAEQLKKKGDPMQDAYAFLRWTMQECIDQGRLRDEFADADLAAQIAWGAMHGVVALHVTHGKDSWVAWADVERRIEGAISALTHGMVVPAAATPSKAIKKKET